MKPAATMTNMVRRTATGATRLTTPPEVVGRGDDVVPPEVPVLVLAPVGAAVGVVEPDVTPVAAGAPV